MSHSRKDLVGFTRFGLRNLNRKFEDQVGSHILIAVDLCFTVKLDEQLHLCVFAGFDTFKIDILFFIQSIGSLFKTDTSGCFAGALAADRITVIQYLIRAFRRLICQRIGICASACDVSAFKRLCDIVPHVPVDRGLVFVVKVDLKCCGITRLHFTKTFLNRIIREVTDKFVSCSVECDIPFAVLLGRCRIVVFRLNRPGKNTQTGCNRSCAD